MTIYIIAGENSGDFIGGLLINAIKNQNPEIIGKSKFRGVGGQHMQEAGLHSIFPLEQINLMGFVEILPHIIRLKKLINKTVEDILLCKPKIVVTIDAPGFTFRVAENVKKVAPHIKFIHIVAPSVWAYRPSRAKKYAKIYDYMLTLLPFEPQYFMDQGMGSTCIGHPVLEQNFYKNSSELRKEMGINDNVKIITVTAGSRRGEISRHMPIIKKIFDRLSMMHNIKVIFVQPNDANNNFISKFLAGANFDYSFSTDRLKVFAVSDCALAKSGTNTLEIAASGTPMVVGYKLNMLTFYLLKMLLQIKYASLINIIPNREIIPEYIQSDFNAENIITALDDLLNNAQKAKDQVQQAQKILHSIGLHSNQRPSFMAAKIITDMI